MDKKKPDLYDWNKTIQELADLEPRPDQHGLIPRTPEAEIVYQEFLGRCKVALSDQSSRLPKYKEIMEMMPQNDGYAYYLDFGMAIAKAQLAKDEARIGALIDTLKVALGTILSLDNGKDWLGEIYSKIHSTIRDAEDKSNPTSEVKGNV